MTPSGTRRVHPRSSSRKVADFIETQFLRHRGRTSRVGQSQNRHPPVHSRPEGERQDPFADRVRDRERASGSTSHVKRHPVKRGVMDACAHVAGTEEKDQVVPGDARFLRGELDDKQMARVAGCKNVLLEQNRRIQARQEFNVPLGDVEPGGRELCLAGELHPAEGTPAGPCSSSCSRVPRVLS